MRNLNNETKKDLSIFAEVLELGYKDSNLEMTESESVALPFGDTPMFCNEGYYIIVLRKMQAHF